MMTGPETHDPSALDGGMSGVAAADDKASAPDDLVWVCRSTSLPRPAYRFYRALLQVFPERGGPPDRATLRRLARRFSVDLETTLTTFATHDLVQRHPARGAIRAAYPFSGVPTSHRVALPADSDGPPAVEVYAMCALDALGIPLMLRRRALIASADVLTGEAVRVLVRPTGASEQTARRGLSGWVATWEPSTAVVYACPEREQGAGDGAVAASYRCPATNFFVTAEQAEQWRASHGSSTDLVLGLKDALKRASVRFGGVLDRLEGNAEQ